MKKPKNNLKSSLRPSAQEFNFAAPSQLDSSNSNFKRIQDIPEFVPSQSFAPTSVSTSPQQQYSPTQHQLSPQTQQLSPQQHHDYPLLPSVLHSSMNQQLEQLDFGPLMPLSYHLCLPPLPPAASSGNPGASPLRYNADQSLNKSISDFYLPQDLHQKLSTYSEHLHKGYHPSTLHNLPTEIHSYHLIFPLNPSTLPISPNSATSAGLVSTLYRATSSVNGQSHYLLKRLHSISLPSSTHLYNIINPLSLLTASPQRQHPNIVPLYECFTTKSFHDDSLVFVYHFYPMCVTLQLFLQSRALPHKAKHRPSPIAEDMLWSWICQIASALTFIHEANMACRCLSLDNLLLSQDHQRLRINCLGIVDVLSPLNSPSQVLIQQQEDLFAFGQVIMSIACNAVHVPDYNTCMDILARHSPQYSPDLLNFISFLFSPPSPAKTIKETSLFLAPRLMTEYKSAQIAQDFLETNLRRELENGRISRLLIKLGFINERPEFEGDEHWSETGDRYLLKLFRDYIFHQVDSKGHPVMDMSHVIRCLNMFDAGSEERIMLCSRDERSLLIVSFADLKRCADTAFGELLHKK